MPVVAQPAAARCAVGSLCTGPGAVPLRDGDGPIESEVAFIYAKNPLSDFGLGYPEGWHWNETSDPTRGVEPIQGDWLIRLNVTPMPSGESDAGVTPLDAGMGDAGTSSDAGSTAGDAGGGGAMDHCTADPDCAGGERCVAGTCQRISCAAATDCAGGMTCVNGMCRSLCAADAECRGGEVCDTAAGHCAPVSMESGGCGCRTVGTGGRSSAAVALLGIALALLSRRRRK